MPSPEVPAPAPPAASRPRTAALAAVALAAVAAYAVSLPNEFVWDDLDQVQDNPFIRRLADLPDALTKTYWEASAAQGGGYGHYRPLTTASYIVSYAVTGASPAGFRAVNLVLHAACAVLVAVLAAELGFAAAWALVAGLLFALHPVNSEAVIWIVGRAELGAATGALAALLLWLRGTRAGRPALVAGASLALLAALGFKESAASAVPIAAVIAFYEAEGGLGRRTLAALRRAAPLAASVVAFLVLQRALLGRIQYGDTVFFAGTAPWQVALTMAKVVVAYVGLLLAPVRLRAHYDTADFAIPATVADPVALAALALDLALVAAVAVAIVRRRRSGLGGAWIACGLLPYLHVVPFPWLMAERFLYVSSAGFALLAASAGEALASRLDASRARALPKAVAAAALLLYAPRTFVRSLDWRDEVTFFTKMVEQEPDLIGARLNLASALVKRGRPLEGARQMTEAYRLGLRPPGP